MKKFCRQSERDPILLIIPSHMMIHFFLSRNSILIHIFNFDNVAKQGYRNPNYGRKKDKKKQHDIFLFYFTMYSEVSFIHFSFSRFMWEVNIMMC